MSTAPLRSSAYSMSSSRDDGDDAPRRCTELTGGLAPLCRHCVVLRATSCVRARARVPSFDSSRSLSLSPSLSPRPLSLSLSLSVSSERSGQAGNAPRRQRAFSPSPCSRMDHRRNSRASVAVPPDTRHRRLVMVAGSRRVP